MEEVKLDRVNREAEGEASASLNKRRPTEYAADAVQFLADVANDPYAGPSDSLAAWKALMRVAAPTKRRTPVRTRMVVHFVDRRHPDRRSLSGDPPYVDTSLQGHRSLPGDSPDLDPIQELALTRSQEALLRAVDVMNDCGAPKKVRIAAASAILNDAPATEEEEVVICVDERVRGIRATSMNKSAA